MAFLGNCPGCVVFNDAFLYFTMFLLAGSWRQWRMYGRYDNSVLRLTPKFSTGLSERNHYNPLLR